jgi:hypothetical protein
MSNVTTQHQTGLRSPRTAFLVAAAILAIGGVLFIWIVTGNGGTSSRPLGGPNEAARGAAVSSAVGDRVSPAGGPNETARGQAVSTASGSVVVPGGPNETARGQSVSSAASH